MDSRGTVVRLLSQTAITVSAFRQVSARGLCARGQQRHETCWQQFVLRQVRSHLQLERSKSNLIIGIHVWNKGSGVEYSLSSGRGRKSESCS